jgi:hypothetical protein
MTAQKEKSPSGGHSGNERGCGNSSWLCWTYLIFKTKKPCPFRTRFYFFAIKSSSCLSVPQPDSLNFSNSSRFLYSSPFLTGKT